MPDITYTQPEKNEVRNRALRYAIESLTTNRSCTCCVERDYVRNLFNALCIEPSVELKGELHRIDTAYIDYWEQLHDSCVGTKNASDLVVCYLSGPEPQNDFSVLTSLGILPQNIWAFEYKKELYQEALSRSISGTYPQPRLIRQSIETFFRNTPRKFDIVYLDACGIIPSSQHALRCVASMSKYHRLASPGILITNFACPTDVEQDHIDCIAEYLFNKLYPNVKLPRWDQLFLNNQYVNLRNTIKQNFHEYYGDFITSCLCDVCAIIMPLQRFVNSENIGYIIDNTVSQTQPSIEIMNNLVNCSLGRTAMLKELIDSRQNKYTENLWKEFLGDIPYKDSAAKSLLKVFLLKSNPSLLKNEIREIYDKADDPKVFYLFLDKPFGGIYLDFIINQLAYPMHAKTSGIQRFQYRAKETHMFTDVIPLDECRYIYDWLPGMHQMEQAYSDNSWQDIFRFALDGLVKQRLKYNNEFFFRGSVIDKYESGFEQKTLAKREVIERRYSRESA